MDDKLLRRAGLDYHEFAGVRAPCLVAGVAGVDGAADPARCSPSPRAADAALADVALARAATGWCSAARSRGLPAALRDAFAPAQRVRLPMRPGQRSLNLSNAVAVAVFEAWRHELRRRGVSRQRRRYHSLRAPRVISCSSASPA